MNSALLPGGLRLPYVEQGDPHGVPVVLLHGYPDSWRSFERMLGHLPGSVHAIAPTQRGWAGADAPPDGYGAEDGVADLAALLDAVGLERAVLVGHSWGSLTAQWFAARHPERVLGLALIGALHTGDLPVLHELWDVVRELSDPIDRGFAREFQESTLAEPIPPAFLDTLVDQSAKAPARVWRATLRGIIDGGAPSDAGPIAAPTLQLWGDQDGLARRDQQQALLAAIPGAELVTYPGAGHSPLWERPERVAADVAAFVARLPIAA